MIFWKKHIKNVKDLDSKMEKVFAFLRMWKSKHLNLKESYIFKKSFLSPSMQTRSLTFWWWWWLNFTFFSIYFLCYDNLFFLLPKMLFICVKLVEQLLKRTYLKIFFSGGHALRPYMHQNVTKKIEIS